MPIQVNRYTYLQYAVPYLKQALQPQNSSIIDDPYISHKLILDAIFQLVLIQATDAIQFKNICSWLQQNSCQNYPIFADITKTQAIQKYQSPKQCQNQQDDGCDRNLLSKESTLQEILETQQYIEKQIQLSEDYYKSKQFEEESKNQDPKFEQSDHQSIIPVPVFPSSDTECLNIPRLKSVDFVSGTYKVRNTYRDKLSFDSYKTFIVINPFEYNQKQVK